MPKLFDLAGKVALVAGGGGYLGRPICETFAAHGATVVVADLRRHAAEAVARAITQNGGKAHAVVIDTGDEQSINDVVNAVHREHGQLDVLVNTSVYCTGKSHAKGTVDDWQRCLQVTLTGAFLLARAASRIMLPQARGSIIHFSSMYGLVSPDPRNYADEDSVNPPDYGAAKAGVLQLTRYQAVQWGAHGVRVNAIVPGPFPNPTIQQHDPAFVDRLSQRVPLNRIGQANEIAGPTLFLASDASSYVNGASLIVDGGWTAW
ncbi:SDR family NAD(P)-dependent oxidoreductase [Phycisphaerales bacterium AB-hyl4]|uniref:SDR family NAD(P)-dependent oxidoreductase n=1 Tax=Natronomicrosphaera hydrolytica TaxID=3242702 RepID=A0ABV4U9J7_9BACT